MYKLKIFSVLAIWAMTVSVGLRAQEIAVHGTVTDAGGPVMGAVVMSDGAGAVTNDDG